MSNVITANGLSIIWPTKTATQLCLTLGCRHYHGSTALIMLESDGMHKQIRLASLTWSQLVYILGQRCWAAWGTFWSKTDQCITTLIAWRKEENSKKVADVPPSTHGNNRHSTRPTLEQFQGKILRSWAKSAARGFLQVLESCDAILKLEIFKID